MEALDRLGLADDTISSFSVITAICTDPYGQFVENNSHGRSGEGPLHHQHRSWLYVQRGPALCFTVKTEQKMCHAPINHVDIAPTTLGLCNISVPDWMEGYDYSGALTSKSLPKPIPDSAFINAISPRCTMIASVRLTGNHHYRRLEIRGDGKLRMAAFQLKR